MTKLLIKLGLLIVSIPGYSQLASIEVKVIHHNFKKINNTTLIRVISDDSSIIVIDTFRKIDGYWIFNDSINCRIELGEKFIRYRLREIIYRTNKKKGNYIKNGNWYYLNYSRYPISFKKRKYSRFRKHSQSDLAFFS